MASRTWIRPIHLNRIFRQHGWLTVKDELGLEILDAGASKVFAVADHQVAHIYLNDRSLESKVRDVLEKQVAVDLTVLGATEKSRPALTIRAPVTSSPSRRKMRGSLIIIGWMTRARRILRGRWTSIASPATTRWNCFSIRKFRRRN